MAISNLRYLGYRLANSVNLACRLRYFIFCCYPQRISPSYSSTVLILSMVSPVNWITLAMVLTVSRLPAETVLQSTVRVGQPRCTIIMDLVMVLASGVAVGLIAR